MPASTPTVEGRALRARVNRVRSSVHRRRRAPPSIITQKLFVISKRIVTRFFQDFLYFTGVPMRNIAALSSAWLTKPITVQNNV
jgi:hypothetical protein